MIHLVTFLVAHPDTTQDEIAAFVYNKGGTLYSKQRISEHLNNLEIIKKKASIKAFQALSAEVQFRVITYWNCPPSLRIFKVHQRKLIDIDEFGVTLERCNHTAGWALKVFRVQKDGYYGHSKKITVLFAIKLCDPALTPQVYGSVEHPRWLLQCLWSKGTMTNVFQDFCELVCLDIEMNGIGGTDNHQIFIWDNLRAHHAAYVHEPITNRAGPQRFSIVPRPQYHPKFGLFEYTICKVTSQLWLKKEANWGMDDLEQQICRIAKLVSQFNPTFQHCGYQW
jgi:hypothetical protein